jgi:hypothetical protein
MTKHRKERVLWLGYQLAVPSKWLNYDRQSKQPSVATEFQKEYQEYDPREHATLTGKEGTVSRSSTFDNTTTGDEIQIASAALGLIEPKDIKYFHSHGNHLS